MDLGQALMQKKDFLWDLVHLIQSPGLPTGPVSTWKDTESCVLTRSPVREHNNNKKGAVNHLFRRISLIAYFMKTQQHTKPTLHFLGNEPVCETSDLI